MFLGEKGSCTVSGNNLEIVLEMACEECAGEIRENGKDEYNMWTVYVHVGEPCRRFYGKDPATHEGFPVERPQPTRRCKACWVPGTDTGRIEVRQEAWGDRSVCLGSGKGDGCKRENYYSIGD